MQSRLQRLPRAPMLVFTNRPRLINRSVVFAASQMLLQQLAEELQVGFALAVGPAVESHTTKVAGVAHIFVVVP